MTNGTGGGTAGGGTAGGGTAGGGTAGGGSGADAGMDAGVPSTDPRVFVTSVQYTGDLVTAAGGITDGQAAGDALCRSAAADAGLGGTWMALVAVGNDSAFTRLTGAPYTLVGTATTVFRTANGLRANPEVIINRTEFGSVAPPSFVWTATDPNGVNNGVACGDWTTTSGNGSVGVTDGGLWTGDGYRMCSLTGRLYCFEF